MMPPKSDKKKERRVVLRSDDEWIADINEWRRQQPDLPPLSEAIRKLVIVGLKTEREKQSAS